MIPARTLVLTILDMHMRAAPATDIIAVAERALAAERERCARVAEDYADGECSASDAAFIAKYGVDTVAAAIRALD